MDGGVRPSGLPKTTYRFPEWFSEYVQDQLGVVTGHQGFDNNILMAEAFQKILPQVLNALEMGMLDNPMTHKSPKTKIDQLLVDRINQIWKKGIYCIIIRDEQQPEKIIQRAVAYKSRERIIVIDGTEYHDPWDLAMPCPRCYQADPINIQNSDYVGFMKDGNFTVQETTCFTHCLNCGYEDTYEVEIKPSFQNMNPLRPVTYNTVWVEISVEPMIKYALEGIDLMTLASSEGGYGYMLGSVFYPYFTSYEEVLESINTTRFPSQSYYHRTIELLFSEWLYYYNILLPVIHQLITEKNRVSFDSNDRQRTSRMEHDTTNVV